MKIILIPSLLLGFAIGAMTAPVVADGLNHIDGVNDADAWEITKHKLIVSGAFTREELEEDDDEQSYWARHHEDFKRWTAHANKFLAEHRRD